MRRIFEGRILIVDDSSSIRDLLSDFFSSNGYEVATARNGDEALKMLKEKHFSMLVTDLNMSIMNGIELINEVRNLNISLIIIGMSVEDNEVKFLEAGSDYFLSKPFDFLYLKFILGSVFRQ
jgi:DNA-binding response OmpR family regulator